MNIFTINKTQFCHGIRLLHKKNLFQGLKQSNNMKLWKKMIPKLCPQPFTQLKGRTNDLKKNHLHLLNIPIHQLQAANIMSHIIFNNYCLSYEHVMQLFEIFFLGI
jgi:hypothetical protein